MTAGVALLAGLAHGAPDLTVPSGQIISLYDVRAEGAVVRFRFLAPEIARETGVFGYADVMDDFASLCAEVAVPWLSEEGLTPDQVVISLGDRETEFGAADPLATQFFEAFSISDGACIWEEF